MNFRIGQKVVCVAPPPAGGWIGCVVGEIYTIRSMQVCPVEKQLGLRLHGITLPICSLGGEGAFYATRFRPVVERKTDISIFVKMLHPSTQKVSA